MSASAPARRSLLTTVYCLLFLTPLLLLPVHGGDRGAGYFEDGLVGAAHEQGLLAHGGDGGDDAARRDDLVARLELRDHLAQGLLALLLRPEQDEVEDAEHQQQHYERAADD